MPSEHNGVKISFREIYDATQEVNQELKDINARLQVMEKQMQYLEEAREQSQEAQETSNTALERAEQMKEEQKWFHRKIIGTLITSFITIIIWGLVYLF